MALPVLMALVFAIVVMNAIYAYCVAKPHNDAAYNRRSLSARENASSVSSSSGHSELALLFYTLTTPGVSLAHLSFELIMHHHTPQYLRRRSASIFLVVTSSLLAAGWLTTLVFWMHCELPSLDRSGQAVCPAQVRGHFMYGIHEVSIAKATLGWIVLVAYAAHVAVLAAACQAQRRIWKLAGKLAAAEPEHGQAVEIVRVSPSKTATAAAP
jgi:hypothetical protein